MKIGLEIIFKNLEGQHSFPKGKIPLYEILVYLILFLYVFW